MANMYGISDSLFGDKGFYKSDPVGNFNFVLTVEGIYDIPLKGVRAFQKVNQFEKIREGGVNDYVHMKRAPIQDAHTIQFERYVSGTLLDPLANGAELAMPVILWLKRSANNSYTDARAAGKNVEDGDFDSSSVRLYIFTGCVVVSKEYGALDAEHSGLATEVVTMAYKELYVVPNLYTFFGGGTDISSWGQTGELKYPVSESDRKDFEARKQKNDEAAKKNKELAEDAAKKAEEDKKKAEEYMEQSKKAAEEAKTKAAEEEAKRKADVEAAKKKREEENKKVAEEEAKKAEETKKKAEESKKKREAANKEQSALEDAGDIRKRAKEKRKN